MNWYIICSDPICEADITLRLAIYLKKKIDIWEREMIVFCTWNYSHIMKTQYT